jgi:hypothetical protein
MGPAGESQHSIDSLFSAAAPIFSGMLPPAYLSKKLSQTLPTKDDGVLRMIADALGYMVALPEGRVRCRRCLQIAKPILDQADVTAVSRQVHLALFYDAQLDIGAMDV